MFKLSFKSRPSARTQQWLTPNNFALAVLCCYGSLANTETLPRLIHKYRNFDVILPYLVINIFLVIPLVFVEFALGQYTKEGLVGAWKAAPIWKGVGWASLSLLFVVGCCCSYVTAKSFYYAVHSLLPVVPWSQCGATWSRDNCYNITKYRTYLEDCRRNKGEEWCAHVKWQNSVEQYYQLEVLTVNWKLFVISALILCLIFVCLRKSITSVQQVVSVLTLTPFLLLVILLLTALLNRATLKGICQYFSPKFSLLYNARAWVDAFNVATFSIGLGLGNLVAVASHNYFHTNIYVVAIVTPLFNIVCDIFYCLFLFLSFASYDSSRAEEMLDSGNSLSFVQVPMVLLKWPYSVHIWGFTYFVFLFFIGFRKLLFVVFTLSKSLAEEWPTAAFYSKSCNALVCILIFLFTLPFFTNIGHTIYDIVQIHCQNTLLGIVIVLQFVGFFYVYGAGNLMKDVYFMLNRKVPTVKYLWIVLPLLLAPIAVYNIYVWCVANQTINSKWIFSVEVIMLMLPFLLWIFWFGRYMIANRHGKCREFFRPDKKWGAKNPEVRRSRDLFKVEAVGKEFTYRQELFSRELA